MVNIGEIYRVWERYQEALDHLQQALQIAREVGYRVGEAAALNSIGLVYKALWRYQEALDHFQQTLQIAREVGPRIGEAAALNNIGLMYEAWGRLQEALDNYQEALQITQEVDDRVGEGNTPNNIGVVYKKWGRFQEALDHLQQALQIRREVGHRGGEGRTLNAIGLVYGAWGRHQEALDHHQEALQIAWEVSSRVDEGKALNNISAAYYYLGRHQEALDHFQQALQIRREVGDRDGEGTTLSNIGMVYEALGQHQEAHHHYQQALKIRREMGNRVGEATTLSNIGVGYYHLERHQEALDHYQKALKIIREAGDRAGEGKTLNNIGLAYMALDRFAEGFKVLKDSVDCNEGLVGEARSEEIRQVFRGTTLSTCNAVVQLLFRWHRTEDESAEVPSNLLFEAMKFLELGKAREMMDKLEPEQERVDLLAICPEYRELVIEEQQLTDRFLEAERIYSSERRMIDSRTVSQVQLDQMRKDLKRLRRDIQEGCADPGLVRQTADFEPIPSFKTIFNHCPNAIIWEFFFDEAVTPDWFWVLSWSQEEIKLHYSDSFDLDTSLGLLQDAHKALSRNIPDYETANKHLIQLSNILGRTLPRELWQTLEGKDLLIMVPHERLHLLPWSIAKNPSAAGSSSSQESSDFLGLSLPIVRSYSLGLVISCLKREQAMANRLLFVANPNFNIEKHALAGADEEVNSIVAGLLPTISPDPEVLGPLYHAEATEEKFRTLVAEGPSVIHFSGHGVFDLDDPWRSHLRFYEEDGYSPYTVTEMILHRFPESPLFVLSACETARGKISRGDEGTGILRGLTLAGATSILATNWRLSDSVAPYFMYNFYEHFLLHRFFLVQSVP